MTALDGQLNDLTRRCSATGNRLVHNLIVDQKQVLVFQLEPFLRIAIKLFSLILNQLFDFFQVKVLVEVVPRLVGLTQGHHQCTEVHVRLSVLSEDVDVLWFENFPQSVEVPDQGVSDRRAFPGS